MSVKVFSDNKKRNRKRTIPTSSRGKETIGRRTIGNSGYYVNTVDQYANEVIIGGKIVHKEM